MRKAGFSYYILNSDLHLKPVIISLAHIETQAPPHRQVLGLLFVSFITAGFVNLKSVVLYSIFNHFFSSYTFGEHLGDFQ